METLSDCRERGPVSMDAQLRALNGNECIIRQVRVPLQHPCHTKGKVLVHLNKLQIRTRHGWLAAWCNEVRNIAQLDDKTFINLRPGIRLRKDVFNG